MISEMPPVLQTFYEPQMEQFGYEPMRARFGVAARTVGEAGTGTMWVAALGPDCLVSTHSMTMARPFMLEEHPEAEHLCVTSLSHAALACRPRGVRAPKVARPSENVVAYVRRAGPERCAMLAGRTYDCASICLLPSYLRRVEQTCAQGCPDLAREISECTPEELSPALRPLLRSLGGARERVVGGELFLRAKLLEATSELVETAHAHRLARQGVGSAAQEQLARRVREAVDASLAGPAPTIAQLADALGVGRTRLCAEFRQATGETIGAYALRRRMDAARDLLATTDLAIAEVARRVGYAQPGSFTDAFERACGETPSAWRARRR